MEKQEKPLVARKSIGLVHHGFALADEVFLAKQLVEKQLNQLGLGITDHPRLIMEEEGPSFTAILEWEVIQNAE